MQSQCDPLLHILVPTAMMLVLSNCQAILLLILLADIICGMGVVVVVSFTLQSHARQRLDGCAVCDPPVFITVMAYIGCTQSVRICYSWAV